MKKGILIIIVILGIILILSIILYIYEINTSKIVNKYINKKITYLDIDVKVVDLTIKTGDMFKIETDNKYISIKEHNSKLSIEERHHFLKTNHNNLTIYIPENYSFSNIKLDTGVGLINIDSLMSNKIEFDLGVGDITINNLIANDYIEIDSGVGKVYFNGNLLGNSKIDTGLGSIDINILNNMENYKFIITEGIGNTKLNGNDINTNIYGNGNNTITINSGLGSVKINTID